jgi:hypothetical protein
MRKIAIAVMTGALLASTPLLTGTARAEVEVKKSSTPSFKVGARYGETSQLSVPGGSEVEFFKLPTGPTYTVTGPYTGTLADYTNPCPWWKSAVGSCKEAPPTTGGTRGVEVPGAVRGFKRPDQPPK